MPESPLLRGASIGEPKVRFPLVPRLLHGAFALHGAPVLRDRDAEALSELGGVARPGDAVGMQRDIVPACDATYVEVQHRAGVVCVIRAEDRDAFWALRVVHLRVHAEERSALDALEHDVAAQRS